MMQSTVEWTVVAVESLEDLCDDDAASAHVIVPLQHLGEGVSRG